MREKNVGILDNRFLSRSIGLLNPPEAIAVEGTDSIEKAYNILLDNEVGCVVVTDERGKLIGIFTERDAIVKIVGTGMDIKNTPVSEVMTPDPHSEEMTASLAYALYTMSKGGYRHIPIVDGDDYPVAILSVKNIVDYIVNTFNKNLGEFDDD